MTTTDWWQPKPSRLWPPARNEIIRRRRQMLVHSAIYYRLDGSLVSDAQWQTWAFELAYLQDLYGWEAGFYDSVFRDWDGSTGYHLPGDDAIMAVARRLLGVAPPPPPTRHQLRRKGLFA